MAISVYSEITDEGHPTPRGSIFYDAGCSFCRRWVLWVAPILQPRGFAFVPLQDSGAAHLLHLDADHLLDEMRLLMPTGEMLGGADAIIELARHICWAWPLVALARIPGMRSALRAAYRQIAARRYCAANCRASESNPSSCTVANGGSRA